MADFADKRTVPHNLVLNLKPYYRRVESCKVNLTLGSSVLAEGSATDEDMQSLASVLSIKSFADCANLDDFSDEESSGAFRMAGTNSAASLEMQNALTNIQNLSKGIVSETRSNRSGTNASTDADSFKNLDREFEMNNLYNNNTLSRTKKTLIMSKPGGKEIKDTSTPLRLIDLGKSKTISSLTTTTSTSTPLLKKSISRLQEAPRPAKFSSKNVTSKDSAIGQTQNELLDWVKTRLSDPETGNRYEQISITNFTTSWRNGLAFCALYDSFYYGVNRRFLRVINSAFTENNLSENPDFNFKILLRADAYENLKLAFNCFKNRFNIEKIIDTRDLLKAPRIDKLKIITYLNFIKDFEKKIEKEAENILSKSNTMDNDFTDDKISITSKCSRNSMRTGSVTSSLVLSPKVSPKKTEEEKVQIIEKPLIPVLLQDKYSQDFEDALEGALSDVEIEGAEVEEEPKQLIPQIEIISPTKSFIEQQKSVSISKESESPIVIGQPPLTKIREMSIDELLEQAEVNNNSPQKIEDLPPPDEKLLKDSDPKIEDKIPERKLTPNPVDDQLSKMLEDFTRELSDLSPKKVESSSSVKKMTGSTGSMDSIDKLILNSQLTRDNNELHNEGNILVGTDSGSDSDSSSEFSFTVGTNTNTGTNTKATSVSNTNKVPKEVSRNPSIKRSNSRSSSSLSLNKNFDEKMVSPENDLEQLEKRTSNNSSYMGRRQNSNSLLYGGLTTHTSMTSGISNNLGKCSKAPSINDIEKELINPNNLQLIDTTKNLRNNALKSRSEAQFSNLGDIQEKVVDLTLSANSHNHVRPSNTTNLGLIHPHKMIDRRKSDIGTPQRKKYVENEENFNASIEVLESHVVSQVASAANFGDVTQELTKMTEQICGEMEVVERPKTPQKVEETEELPRTESNDVSKESKDVNNSPDSACQIPNIVTSPRRKNPLPSQRAAEKRLEEKLSYSMSDELENVDSAKEISPIQSTNPFPEEIEKEKPENLNQTSEIESESDSNLSLNSEASTTPSLIEEYRRKEEEFVDIDEMAKDAEERFRKNFSSAEEEELATKDWIAIVHKRKQLESDMEELNIRKQEQKLEAACRNLDKIILKLSTKIDPSHGPTPQQRTQLENLQNQRINLVEQKSALVEKIDELQADSVNIANTLVANLQKHTDNSNNINKNTSSSNSNNVNLLGGINSQAASQAASSAMSAASNLFGKNKWW